MQEIASVEITVERGLEDDHKGAKFAKRQITIMSLEAWQTAISELGADALKLPWTTRRANLLVEGVRLPRARGGIVRIGAAEFEVWYPTQPCQRMEKAYPGLLKALHPDWRGGIACAVRSGGFLRLGDDVEILVSPPERRRDRLPG